MKIELIVKITVATLFAMVLFSGQATATDVSATVELSDGTFAFHPSNDASASYTVDWMTAMGALEQAQDDGILTYNATDYWYGSFGSFYLTEINGITEGDGAYWFLYINDEFLSYGLGLNEVEDGDVAQFRYCEYSGGVIGTPIHTVDLTVEEV